MKKYTKLNTADIARFEKYAQENDLGDWTIGITENMTTAEAEKQLIARCRVKEYKKLTPEDIVEFERTIENAGISFDFRRIKENITPGKLRKLAQATVNLVRDTLAKADSKPMTVGQ